MKITFDSPSPRNWMALLVIEKYLRAYEVAPTLEELRQKLGLRSVSAVRAHVLHLEEFGLLSYRRTGRRLTIAPRSLRLTTEGKAALRKYRALVESGIMLGTHELALTEFQFERLRAAGLPVDAFRRRKWKERVILTCRNWRERDYWGERMIEVLRGQ